jgi:L-malate glycosyltransferase
MKIPVLLMARELDLGGSERQMTEIALGLDRNRFDPHVGAFRPQGLRADDLRAAGVPVMHLPVYSFRSAAALRGVWQLASYIRRHKIRLVHTFDAPTTVYAAAVTHYLTSAVSVSSQRGHRGLTPEMRRLLRWTDRLVDGVVVNCEYLNSHLVRDEGVPAKRVHVCYNGVDFRKFRPGPRLRGPLLRDDALVIGTVCAMRPEKGLTTLVDAFARIRTIRPRMKLAFVGSGAMLDELQQHAKQAGIFADCVWQGATSEVPQWLRTFDIFVLPSVEEAFSNSLIEAMACGRAVVASNVGGNIELIRHGENGLLFQSRNVEALSEALRCLIDDGHFRQQLATSAERYVRARFSRETSANRMSQIYDELLATCVHSR